MPRSRRGTGPGTRSSTSTTARCSGPAPGRRLSRSAGASVSSPSLWATVRSARSPSARASRTGRPTHCSRPASRSPSSSRVPWGRWPRPATSVSWYPRFRSTSSTGWVPATPSGGPCATACSAAGRSNASSPGLTRPGRLSPRGSSVRQPCPARTRSRRSLLAHPSLSSTTCRTRTDHMISTDEIGWVRAYEPERIAQVLRNRPRGMMARDAETKLMIITADPMAMADRGDLLARCVEALSRPGVHGFLGTADIIEELALLGALDDKLVYGSMNRGGLAGASFEMDDRFTGYDARGVSDAGLDGGKMLLRIDLDDPGTIRTIEACAGAVDERAGHQVVALVEPFISRRVGGEVRSDLTPDAVIRSIAITSGLGRTSAYTWLKLPCVPEMERVMRSEER